MLIFQTTRGRVVRLLDPAAQCNVQTYQLDSAARIEFERDASIVTRLTVSRRANVQFLHTLGEHIYIYSFGDRVGQIGLSGLAFSCVCDRDVPGAEMMLRWYSRNRVSSRSDPLTVTIGGVSLEGFVVEFGEDVVDPSINLVQWNATMVSLPEDKK